MSLQIKRRGRPSKQMLAERSKLATKKARTDIEVLTDLKDRFDMLGKLTHGAIASNIRSMVVTGAPGVGKSFTVEQVLERLPEQRKETVRGAISAVELYKLGYRMRKAGSVIVLDDADSIFTDEDALNILKALCDSSPVRKVSWLKDSNTLRQDDVPQSYDFHGSFIFISNLDFQKYVDMGSNKYVAHFEALMSRSLYLDLRLHDRQAISLWVEHIATSGKMFAREGVTDAVGTRILGFVKQYRDELRELSLRTTMKLCQLAKSHPGDWERMGRVLLCR
jgi:predicted ATPase